MVKLRSLEALRGLAALSVVISHGLGLQARDLGPSHFQGYALSGGLGVEFFFTLSGFVMGLTHGTQIGRPASIPSFLWSRCRRLLPILWIVIALHWATSPIHLPWTMWLDSAALNPRSNIDVIPVLWSLKVEAGYYVMLALAMLPLIGFIVLPLAVLIPTIILFWPALLQYLPVPAVDCIRSFMTTNFGAFFIVFSPDFLVGLLFGYLFVGTDVGRRFWWLLAACGVAAIALRLPFDEWGMSYGPPSVRYLYSASFGAIMLGLSRAEQTGALRLGRWAVVLGVASYPTYLCHLMVIDRLYERVRFPGLWSVTPGDFMIVAAIILSVLTGVLLGYFVDQPIQRWLRHLDRHFTRSRAGRLAHAAPADGAP